MAITLYIEGDVHPVGHLSERSYRDTTEIKDAKADGSYNWSAFSEAQAEAKRMIRAGHRNVSITQYDSQSGYGAPMHECYSDIKIN